VDRSWTARRRSGKLVAHPIPTAIGTATACGWSRIVGEAYQQPFLVEDDYFEDYCDEGARQMGGARHGGG
jgi:hypothetical protein